jgi:hypothetical protein
MRRNTSIPNIAFWRPRSHGRLCLSMTILPSHVNISPASSTIRRDHIAEPLTSFGEVKISPSPFVAETRRLNSSRGSDVMAVSHKPFHEEGPSAAAAQ